MDNWEEISDKYWVETHPHFARKFNKERNNFELKNSQKNYGNSAVLRKAPHTHTPETPHGGKLPQKQIETSQQQWNTLRRWKKSPMHRMSAS